MNTDLETPRIELPRLQGETAKAYASRLSYVTMGPGRSLERVAERARTAPEPRPTARLATLKRWSALHGWRDAAARYDQALAVAAAVAAEATYRRELEAHREQAMQYGKALCAVAVRMLDALNRKVADLEYTPATLLVIARALTIGMDLEAHALRVADLLPKLDTNTDDEG